MPSPFPGMDPYLEDHWRDVHSSLVIYIRDALQPVMPSALRARVEERIMLETLEGLSFEDRYPDVRVVELTAAAGLAVGLTHAAQRWNCCPERPGPAPPNVLQPARRFSPARSGMSSTDGGS